MSEIVDHQVEPKDQPPTATVEDVKRILEVGKLLLSVITPEELEELQFFFKLHNQQETDQTPDEIGNTGVT